MIGADEVVKDFRVVYKVMNKIMHKDEQGKKEVPIETEEKNKIMKVIMTFASTCRLDLGISEKEAEKKELEDSFQVIKISNNLLNDREEIDEAKVTLSDNITYLIKSKIWGMSLDFMDIVTHTIELCQNI